MAGFHSLPAEEETVTGAENAATNALHTDATQASIDSNLPLALLLNCKGLKAKLIYTRYKGKPYDNERNWTEVFLQDLDDLEAAGVKHPDVAKARALLRE